MKTNSKLILMLAFTLTYDSTHVDTPFTMMRKNHFLSNPHPIHPQHHVNTSRVYTTACSLKLLGSLVFLQSHSQEHGLDSWKRAATLKTRQGKKKITSA